MKNVWKNVWKTAWKTIQKIVNVKRNSDMSINSLLIGEPITTNVKLIPDHFNTFFTSIAAKLNEKIAKAKKPFWYYVRLSTNESTFFSPTISTDIKSLINFIKSQINFIWLNKAIFPNSIKLFSSIQNWPARSLSIMINLFFNKEYFLIFSKLQKKFKNNAN